MAALHVATRRVLERVQEAARPREAAAAPGASPSPWAAAECLARALAAAAKEALDQRQAKPGPKSAGCPLSVPDQGKAASSEPAMGLPVLAGWGQPLPALAAAFREGQQQAEVRHRCPEVCHLPLRAGHLRLPAARWCVAGKPSERAEAFQALPARPPLRPAPSALR